MNSITSWTSWMAWIEWMGAGLNGVSRWLLTSWRPWALFAFFIVCAGFLGASSFAPYTPLSVREIRVVPPVVCSGQGVSVTLDRTWRDPNLLFGIRSVDTESKWIEVNTGATYEAVSTGPQPPSLLPLSGVARSDLVRVAPPDIGTYRLYTVYIVAGRTIMLPAYQVLPELTPLDGVPDGIPSRDVVEVRECDSENPENSESTSSLESAPRASYGLESAGG